MIFEDLKDITQKMICVNGENVYIIENNMENELIALYKYMEMHKDETLMVFLKNLTDFILKHQGFSIIFRPLRRKGIITYLPCCVYFYKNEWVRVTIEKVNCLSCTWNGIAANPSIVDMFFGMNNEIEGIKKMNKYDFINCPKCGNPISRKAIWIE